MIVADDQAWIPVLLLLRRVPLRIGFEIVLARRIYILGTVEVVIQNAVRIPAQLQVKAEDAQVFGDELPHARLEERFVGRLMKVGWIQAAAGNYRNPFIFSYVVRETHRRPSMYMSREVKARTTF